VPKDCSHNDHMSAQTVGSRELKLRLGTYLRRVRNGQRLVVTAHGQPVAELRPIEADTSIDAILVELEARGMVTRPTRKGFTPFTPVKCRGTGKTASQIVIGDREDRF
jgi:prevent-host-death family protein